ncbi:MAG: carboxylating nicotinate-nucleotide diphosphorylase [Candidatus Polarisedimenticolia bacterium]
MDPAVLRRLVRAALEEDLGSGDVTSEAVVPEAAGARGRIVAREPLVVAGLEAAEAVFAETDAALRFRAVCADGEQRSPGALLARVEGRARSILAGERTALNFLQRGSGIATHARRLAERARGTGTEIADTRKTAPGLRAFDKHAVRAGGAVNHRMGLFDAVLIKDNHWRLAGGIGPALRAARTAREAGRLPGPIAIEVGTPAEVAEALTHGADALLLDNMEPPALEAAVRSARGRAFLEVSGSVREADLPRLLALGVQRISIGALTHSVVAADIALEIEPL